MHKIDISVDELIRRIDIPASLGPKESKALSRDISHLATEVKEAEDKGYHIARVKVTRALRQSSTRQLELHFTKEGTGCQCVNMVRY